MNKKTVLVTGATGLVGKAFLQQFETSNKWQCRYLTRRKNAEPLHGADAFYWNPACLAIQEEALNGVEVILNLAGASVSNRWSKPYKAEILSSRINSLKTLHSAISASKHSVKQLVSASAIGFYESDLEKSHSEVSTASDTGFLSNVVQQWEAEADRFESLNISVSKLRFGIVLSTQGGALPKLMQPTSVGFGAALGSGNQWQSWIHINDLIRAIIYKLDAGGKGVYNIVAPHPERAIDLAQTLAKVMKRPFWLKRSPEFIIRLLLGEMSEMVLQSQKVMPQRLLNEGFEFKYPKIDGALSDLIQTKK
jgi:uncharacterized protein (TIGR01777 family)